MVRYVLTAYDRQVMDHARALNARNRLIRRMLKAKPGTKEAEALANAYHDVCDVLTVCECYAYEPCN